MARSVPTNVSATAAERPWPNRLQHAGGTALALLAASVVATLGACSEEGESAEEVVYEPAGVCAELCELFVHHCTDPVLRDLSLSYTSNTVRLGCEPADPEGAVEACGERCEAAFAGLAAPDRELLVRYLGCGAALAQGRCDDGTKMGVFNECANEVCASPECFDALDQATPRWRDAIEASTPDARTACTNGRDMLMSPECDGSSMVGPEQVCSASCCMSTCAPGAERDVAYQCSGPSTGPVQCECTAGPYAGRTFTLGSCTETEAFGVDPWDACGLPP